MLTARTLNEVRYYLQVTACPNCQKGPWEYQEPAGAAQSAPTLQAQATCQACGHQEVFEFHLDKPTKQQAHAELINPTDIPSVLVDLGQWVSLFYMLVEQASAQTDHVAARRLSYRAALCLGEALKFYADGELPPQSAFFTPATQAAFRQHPEKFARQRLADMQAKLPALPKMTRRIKRDDWVASKKWWQFWRW